MFARLVLICLLLSACDGPLSLLTGGGPNVAANVQAGRTNVQTVGTTEITDQRITRPVARSIEQSAGDNPIRTEMVETLVIRNEAPPWVWLLLIVGWLAPSPGEIARGVRKLIGFKE